MSVQNMNRQQDISIVRKDNVLYILRGEDGRVSDWQYRNSFATEARPAEPIIKDYGDKIREYVSGGNYLKAARIAERCSDHALKKSICMDGIMHYDDTLYRLTRSRTSDRKALLNKISAIHYIVSELFMVYGDIVRAERHMNISKNTENEAHSDC